MDRAGEPDPERAAGDLDFEADRLRLRDLDLLRDFDRAAADPDLLRDLDLEPDFDLEPDLLRDLDLDPEPLREPERLRDLEPEPDLDPKIVCIIYRYVINPSNHDIYNTNKFISFQQGRLRP